MADPARHGVISGPAWQTAAMEFDVVFSGVPITDLDAARDWYTRLIGRAPDIPVNETEDMWRLTDTAFLYIVHHPVRAGRAVVTMAVADLDASVAEAAGRGVPSAPLEQVGTAGRKAVFTDPDGNEIALVQVSES